MMMYLGIILIGLAIAGYFWLEKRKFLRISAGGVEQYDSYGALWKSRIVEAGAKLLIAILFILGVISLVNSCFSSSFQGNQ